MQICSKDFLNEKLKYDENIHCGHHEHNDTNVMKINMDVQKISKKSPKMIIIIVPNNIIVTIKK